MSYYINRLAIDISNFIDYLCTFTIANDRLTVIYLDSSERIYDNDGRVKFHFNQYGIYDLEVNEKSFYGNMIIFIDHYPIPNHNDFKFSLCDYDYSQIRDHVFIARTDIKDKTNPELATRVLYSQEVIRRQILQFQDNLNDKFQIIINKYIHEPMPSGKAALIHIHSPSFKEWIEYIDPDEDHREQFGYVVIHYDEPIFGTED